MTSKKYLLLIIILGTLSAIGPFSIDMYLPGFPAIAADLHTTVARISLSLSSFFIGISAGQLIYGPLLDRFGRKNPLYFGLSLYTLASIGCALATSADALIGLRFLQAVGGCAGMVASRAMVRDIFPVSENANFFIADASCGSISHDSSYPGRVCECYFWMAFHLYYLSRYWCSSWLEFIL